MTSLFNDIARIQPNLPGWCTPHKAMTLASIVVARRPAVTVEIGIYGGSSLIPLALAHQAIGSGIVIGIDPWSNQAAIEAQTENESRQWWADQDLEKIRRDLFAQIKSLQLEPFVKIMRFKSDDVEVPNALGCLHVDGSHSDQAIRDVSRFAPNVVMGGFVVTDDSDWYGGGVTRAEQRLAQMRFTKLYALGTGSVFQRT